MSIYHLILSKPDILLISSTYILQSKLNILPIEFFFYLVLSRVSVLDFLRIKVTRIKKGTCVFDPKLNFSPSMGRKFHPYMNYWMIGHLSV